jgi:hypothetical protein
VTETRFGNSAVRPFSLGDALNTAIASWITECAAEPASADRDQRLSNLHRLAAEIAAPQSSRETA